jgi:carboxyl-terminal processing protease
MPFVSKLMVAVLWVLLTGCATPQKRDPEMDWPQVRISLLRDAWSLVQRYYYDREFNGIDWHAAGEQASKKITQASTMEEAYDVLTTLVAELGDSHTHVLSPQKRADIYRQDYEGVGFSTSAHPMEPDLQIVIRVAPDSPAESAGIEPGWLFLNHRGGDDDTQYRFLDRHEQLREFSMTRTIIPKTSTARESRLLDGGNLLYLRFESFDPGIGRWMSEQVHGARGVSGVIVDLRWNPGGYVEELIRTLECFLPPNTLLGIEVTGIRPERPLRTGLRYEISHSRIPVAVLVSEYSASSSEIFAGVLQHYQRGSLVGTQATAGEVMISPSWELAGGGLLRISVKDYRDPAGKRLQGVGVTPDILVGAQSFFDLRRGRDPLLERAIQHLQP